MDSIKILQKKTGAPAAECKKALESTGGSIVKAVRLLRKNDNKIDPAAIASASLQAKTSPSTAQGPPVISAKINIDELAIDAVVSLSALSILFILLPAGRMLSQILTAGTGVVLFLAADFFLPFHVMRIYRRYESCRFAPSLAKKTAMAVASISILFLFVGFPPHLIRINGDIEAFLPFLYFIGIWSAFCGGLIGYESPADNPNRQKSIESAVFGIALMSPPVFGVVLHALGAFNWLERLLGSEKKSHKNALRFIQNIAVPVLVIIMLVLVQQVYIEGTIQAAGSNSSVDPSDIYFFLFLVGVIPLRLISGFAPPVRLLNLIGGVVSFILYIYSVHSSILILLKNH